MFCSMYALSVYVIVVSRYAAESGELMRAKPRCSYNQAPVMKMIGLKILNKTGCKGP